MDADWIITAFVLIDTLMERLGHHSDVRAQVPDSEVVLIAIASAKYFQNHHERAVCILRETHSLSGRIDVTRFNRRLHKLADWLAFIATTLGEILLSGEVFVIDSLPLPVCRRVRARRCRKVHGRDYCGYCAAKKEKFFGWRLHLICTPAGIPVSFPLLPAAFHDLTPIHELAVLLPPGARVFGDKAYNSADDEASMLTDTGVRLIPIRKATMQPHAWFVDDIELHDYRHTIETVNSQCEKMGLEQLYARTNPGFELKVLASIIALACTNIN
ncbi:MAG TPA: IS982 family transposase [Methylophilaceae bacterium]|nr:IS982 family transposase [Methylophilaceae bacterium]